MREETIPPSLPPPPPPLLSSPPLLLPPPSSPPVGLLCSGRRKPLLRSCGGDLNASPRRRQRRTAGSERSGRVRVTSALRFGCLLIGFGLLTETGPAACSVGWLLPGAGGREPDSQPGCCCCCRRWRSVAVGRSRWRTCGDLLPPLRACVCGSLRGWTRWTRCNTGLTDQRSGSGELDVCFAPQESAGVRAERPGRWRNGCVKINFY